MLAGYFRSQLDNRTLARLQLKAMQSNRWMIYGAYGYTGRLIAAAVRERGLTPLLAGRDAGRVEALAAETGLDFSVFDLAQPQQARQALAGVVVVAHCAGPFSATSQGMIDACLATGTHYVDITGEIGVFEAAHARDRAAREAGIVVCPGVGFDVIPTDCLAACLKEALPDAATLALGFDTDGQLSPGTSKTALEGMRVGGQVRRAGRITGVPLGWKRRRINFGRGERPAVTIPWGDVSTAFHTTGIPNIEVYMAAPSGVGWAMRLLNPCRPIFASRRVQGWLARRIAAKVQGPSAAFRRQHRTWVWGEARSPSGAVVTARVETANPYDVTVEGVLLAVEHLLAGKSPPGFITPSRLLGNRCVERLPGSGRIEIVTGE